MYADRRRRMLEIETIEATQQEAHPHESLLARIDNRQTKQFRNPVAPEYLFLRPIHALFALVSILQLYIYPLFIYTLVDGYLFSHRYLPSGISHSFIKGEYISSCSSFLSISTNCKQSLRFRVVLRINEMDDSLSHLLLFFDVPVRDQFREFLFINII